MSAYSSLILAESSLVAYYRLDEQSGQFAYDSSSNAYHGTINNTGGVLTGVTLGQASAIVTDAYDYSMLFDGTAGYINLNPGPVTTGFAALTVECWIYMPVNTFNHFAHLVVNEGSPTTNHVGVRFVVANSTDGGSGYFEVGNGTVGASKRFGVTVTNPITGMLSANTWYHLVGVYNGANLLVYVNGVVDLGANPALTGTIGAATHTMRIATAPSGAGNANFFPGLIDEVAIYNAALSASDILTHYNTGAFGHPGITRFPNAKRRGS